MPKPIRFDPSRRHMVVGSMAAGGTLVLSPLAASSERKLLATPAQSEGPYYPVDWSGDIDHDLVMVTGRPARAKGQVLHLGGRVLETDGKTIAGVVVEIWQTDASGIYRHPGDERGGRRHDPNFQGRGRTETDAEGSYRFRTIRPVAYGGRPPHIHFKVRAGGRSLTTQMYLADEPLNARDGLLAGVRDAKQRDRLIVRLEKADPVEQGALQATFDIVLA